MESFIKVPLINTNIDDVGKSVNNANIKCTGNYTGIKSTKEAKKLFNMVIENFRIDHNGKVVGNGADQNGSFDLKGMIKSDCIPSSNSEYYNMPIWF